jgi:hypothetical protein
VIERQEEGGRENAMRTARAHVPLAFQVRMQLLQITSYYWHMMIYSENVLVYIRDMN